MAERTIVISDIHGCLDTFNRLLRHTAYCPGKDRLMLLGDYVDRGPDSKEVVEQLIRMSSDGLVTALRGNHDQRFVEWLSSPDPVVQAKFLEYGGLPTLQSYCGSEWTGCEWDESRLCELKAWILERYAEHVQFLASRPLFAEDEHHIYVHAGLNPAFPEWKEQPERDFMWIRDPFYNRPTVVDKTVVFGHTLTMELHDRADIWFGGDKIGIDGGCAYGLQLNALEIRGAKEYRSFHLPSDADADTEAVQPGNAV